MFLVYRFLYASARSQWQFVGKAWWGQTLWLLRWKVGERMIIGYVRSASSPSCIVLLIIGNIINQTHCNSKPTFFSSSVLVDRMLGTPPPNQKKNIPNKILTLFHYSPVKWSCCYCLNSVSGFEQNCVLGRFVTIWLLIPVQCTRTPDTTIVPEQLLALCTRYHWHQSSA